MNAIVPALDHVVVDVRHRMEEVGAAYRALGFQLTERGYHSLGSINHLAMFETDYLELLGFGDDPQRMRAELVPFPPGLNGLVFKTDDADARHADLAARGIAVREPQSFSRPVEIAGQREAARFRTVHLAPEAATVGRVYFCRHFTPDLVWRPEWRRHPNGATAIDGIEIAAQDPPAVAGLFAQMFGPAAIGAGPDGASRIMAGAVAIDILDAAALQSRLGAAAPDPAGRIDYMAVLRLRAASLDAVARLLRTNRIEGVEQRKERLRIAAAAAGNVTLDFVE
ncbi:MAG: VOC family protein [Alphaproteobacteria bacterium]|nr:VOC family protein [Alphaproteobacteria bacterium]